MLTDPENGKEAEASTQRITELPAAVVLQLSPEYYNFWIIMSRKLKCKLCLFPLGILKQINQCPMKDRTW